MDPLEISPETFRRLADTIADLSSDSLTTLDSKQIFPKTSGVEVEKLALSRIEVVDSLFS